MADDKSKQDNRDRSKVSSSEEYEVQYLMTKYDLSRNRALELIIKHNRSRKEIVFAAGGFRHYNNEEEALKGFDGLLDRRA